MRNTGGDKYEKTAREIRNDQISAFLQQLQDDLQKSDSYNQVCERKKVLTSANDSLAHAFTNLGAFCPIVDHLPSEKLILSYFSSPRGVAILDCDSHSQAGSTRFFRKFIYFPEVRRPFKGLPYDIHPTLLTQLKTTYAIHI